MRTFFRSNLFSLKPKYLYSNISLKIAQASESATLTLANQKKRNPLSLQTIRQIHAAITEVQSKITSDKLKILILKGDGPVFSAGHDLKELKASPKPQQIFQECTKTLLLLKKLPIITLCAINGVAAAAGLQMALTCDLVIATQKSVFSTPGVKWGLFCSTPGVQLIRSINSIKKANEMLLFGQSITAKEALQYGLINQVVANDKLQTQISTYVGKANQLSGEVLRLGKHVLNNQSQLDLQKAYCVATDGMRQNILQKNDCKQGLTAFAEKRHPHFKN